MLSNNTYSRQFISFSGLNGSEYSGFFELRCIDLLITLHWHVATRDAIWMNVNDIVIREYLACGTLSHGANSCGLLTVLGGDWIDNTRWYFATYYLVAIFIPS